MATDEKRRLIFADYVVQDARSGPEGVLTDSGLYIEGDRIVSVDTQERLRQRYPEVDILGGSGRVALPGLVNAHSHGRGLSTPLQGIPDDVLELWLPTLALLKHLDPYWNTLHSAAQLLRSGVTTVIHSHVGGGDFAAYRRGVERAIEAYEDSRMRVAFAMGFKEQHQLVFDDDEVFLSTLSPSLREKVERQLLGQSSISGEEYFRLFHELYRHHQGTNHPRTTLFLSPVGPQWCTDRFMAEAADVSAATGTGIHIHVSESIYEKWYGYREWNTSVVEHLDDLSLLSPRLSLVHSVWLNEREIQLCADAGAVVVHNPSSNLRLHNGIAPINAMLEAGIPVAMGIDSTALDDDEDMLREMRLALYLHREPGIAASVPDPYQILEMATIGGARAALLDDRIGTLEVGKKADVVLVSLERIVEPYLDPALDIVEAILTRGRAEDVDTVLVDGEILLDGGRLTHLDMPKILNRQREAAQQAQGTKSELRELLTELRTELIHFYRGWHRDENRDPYYILNSRR